MLSLIRFSPVVLSPDPEPNDPPPGRCAVPPPRVPALVGSEPKMHKRTFRTAAVAAASLLALAACGGDDGGDQAGGGATSAPAPGGGTLTIWADETRTTALKPLTQQFGTE